MWLLKLLLQRLKKEDVRILVHWYLKKKYGYDPAQTHLVIKACREAIEELKEKGII